MFEVNDRVKLKTSSVYRHNPYDRYEIIGFRTDPFASFTIKVFKIRNIKTNECMETFGGMIELDRDFYRKLKLKKLYIKSIGRW